MKTKLSSKGQVVLPKAIRDRKGWTIGSELTVEDRGDIVVLRRIDDVPATTLDDVLGCTGYDGPRRSLDDMEAAIARGARARG